MIVKLSKRDAKPVLMRETECEAEMRFLKKGFETCVMRLIGGSTNECLGRSGSQRQQKLVKTGKPPRLTNERRNTHRGRRQSSRHGSTSQRARSAPVPKVK